MHICMVAYSYYETDNRVMRYSEALASRGDDVDVIALKKEGQIGFEQIRGVNVHRIQTRIVNEKRQWSYLFKILLFLFNSAIFLTWRHMRHPYSLIHVHSVPDFEVFAAIMPRLLGAKVILDIHDIVPEFYASKFNMSKKSMVYKTLVWLEKLSTSFAHHVIIANHLWEKTITNRSVKPQKCSVYLNYPDPAIFWKGSEKQNNGKFIMMYPGSLHWHQGLDIAIKAIALLKEKAPGVEFHIYGDGSERLRLQQMVKDMSLEKSVFFNKSIPMSQIAQVMQQADLGVVPKRKDSFGNEAFSTKIFEFMSVGIPVVAANTMIDKYYFDDQTVRFFESGDENDLAKQVLSLYNAPAVRSTLRKNGFNCVGRYDWNDHKLRYFKLVDSLCATRQK